MEVVICAEDDGGWWSSAESSSSYKQAHTSKCQCAGAVRLADVVINFLVILDCVMRRTSAHRYAYVLNQSSRVLYPGNSQIPRL